MHAAAFCFFNDCAFTNLSGSAEVLPSEIFSAHANLCVYLRAVFEVGIFSVVNIFLYRQGMVNKIKLTCLHLAQNVLAVMMPDM